MKSQIKNEFGDVYAARPEIRVTCCVAIKKFLDVTNYDSGRLEHLETTVDNTVKFLGALTQTLYMKGLISRSDVNNITGGRFF